MRVPQEAYCPLPPAGRRLAARYQLPNASHVARKAAYLSSSYGYQDGHARFEISRDFPSNIVGWPTTLVGVVLPVHQNGHPHAGPGSPFVQLNHMAPRSRVWPQHARLLGQPNTSPFVQVKAIAPRGQAARPDGPQYARLLGRLSAGPLEQVDPGLTPACLYRQITEHPAAKPSEWPRYARCLGRPNTSSFIGKSEPKL